MKRPLTFSIDRGGTFTDAIVVNHETQKETVIKVLSVNPSAYRDAPTECVRVGLEWATGKPVPRSQPLPTNLIEQIRIGTTVATNALLERKGARFALVTTKGWKDMLLIGDQSRPDLFDLSCRGHSMLYDSVVEIDERVVLAMSEADVGAVATPSGQHVVVRRAVDTAEARAVLAGLHAKGVRGVAICLLHSAVYPAHEEAVGALARAMGFNDVSLSHRAGSNMVRAVPRGHSACADAYLTPVVRAFMSGFLAGFADDNFKLLFMRSDGGLEGAEQFGGHRAVLSGPAGGVVGMAKAAFAPGRPVIGFDMGGTSTDVSRFAGAYDVVFEGTTAGVVIQAPQLNVNTVASGGGSLLRYRHAMFVVGPESAGARPGPVCYKRPGGKLAVSDANLVLGRLVPSMFPKVFGPNEDEALDLDASLRAFEALRASEKTELGALSVQQIAQGFVDVANEQMCRPIREMTLMKGLDTAEHALCSFGGAGGQHACAIAQALNIKRVIAHRYAGILSAVGLALAAVSSEAQRPCSVALDDAGWPTVLTLADEAQAAALARLGPDAARNDVRVERFVRVRYSGTDVAVPVALLGSALQVHAAFVAAHQSEFGFTLQRAVLVDDVRVRAELASDFVLRDAGFDWTARRAGDADAALASAQHAAYFAATGLVACPVFDAGNVRGLRVLGPAIVMQQGSTVVIEPGCEAAVSALGDVEIRVGVAATQATATTTTTEDAIARSLYAQRFMSVAEQMGRVLRRTAVSVNIKERLDFSCGLFGPDGGLVAHAPYIPVHLGAMSAAVRFQIKQWGSALREGDVLVSNHPQLAGGSHLPDITVFTPAWERGAVVFWVASRAHHADIGGTSAGSMPPHSTRLADEGAAIVALKLVSGGRFMEDAVADVLRAAGSRALADNLSDLRAQVAANMQGVRLIEALVRERSLDVVQRFMGAIRSNAELAVRGFLKPLAGKTLRAADALDDGSPVVLTVRVSGDGSAVFDFAGTGAQVAGNLNAPRAVTSSAIVYALRCMIKDDFPLNEGILAAVDVRIPRGSLLDPSDTAAVVGGNVCTSQRVVDVILKAFGAAADSQGCMNNLSFGDDSFGYYETICGGAGAGPTWEGRSCVHTHMTNTRIGDPEIIERRFPVVVRTFARRQGSGGRGRFNGGDGVVREIEFRKPVTLSVLSERRTRAPNGVEGGGDGAKGVNALVHSNGRTELLGGKSQVAVEVGDVVRVETPGGGAWGRAANL